MTSHESAAPTDDHVVQDETAKGTETSRSVSATEVQSEPAFSEAPGDSALVEVADKRLKEVDDGTNTDPLDINQQTSKKKRRAIQHGIRPLASSPEFAPYFENVVKTSKSREEAVNRMGYGNPSVIYHHMKRLGLEPPTEWRLKPYVSIIRQERVPKVIITVEGGRNWVAALVQGEGCIKTHYSKRFDVTSLEIYVAMTDSAPIFSFCDLVGKGRPQRAMPGRNGWKPVWWTAIGGLRAYRVLQEILPFLLGQKFEEAKRGLEFFTPAGYTDGCFGGYEVWPENEFPLRKRGSGRYKVSLRARGLTTSAGTSKPQGEDHAATSTKMDLSCMRIANELLRDNQLAGTTQTKLMGNTGLGRPTVIHHLRHLERDSLLLKEKVRHRPRGAPGWLYKPSSKLLEMKVTGNTE